MSIYYALVAKETNIILAEHTDYQGNFQQFVMQLMNRIEPESMRTFEIDEYFVHYINDDGISVVCMSDKKINKKHAFAFLQDVKKALLNYYTVRELERAKAYDLKTF
mmetsp:Transcript_32376/g.43825  ORF Transcript_32376/g.43825 Transcript_32376/m.43825 type:complete len:107 (+) Transcript_32376:25-345(+)